MKNPARRPSDTQAPIASPLASTTPGEPFPGYSHYRGLSRNPYYPTRSILRSVARAFHRSGDFR